MGKHHVHTSMADCLSGAVAIATTESVPFAAKQGKGTGGTLRRQAADALYSLGNGRFQLISAFILGVANCSDCVEVFLSAGVFVGMLVGGLFAGLIADSPRLGRKTTLIGCLLLNALFGVISAAAPNVHTLAALRMIAGIGVGGSVPTIFTLLIELLAPTSRGLYINIVAFCWVLGMVFTAGIAWLMLGVGGLAWQWFAAACGFPAIVAALLLYFVVPESPLWLARVGRVPECDAALACIAAWNRKPAPASLVPSEADSRPSLHKLTLLRGGSGAVRGRIGDTLSYAATTLRTFYCGRGGHARSSALLSVVWFTMSLAWYSMAVWQPTIFKLADLSLDVYQDAFINAAANVPGNIVAILVLDRAGRKATLVASMAGSAVCAIGFAFARTQATVLAASCLLSAVSVGSWNALDALSVESFPSAMRSSAMGTLSAVGRAGSIVGQVVFGLLVSADYAPLLAATAVLLGVGAAAGAFLPYEPAGKALDDGGGEGEEEGGGTDTEKSSTRLLRAASGAASGASGDAAALLRPGGPGGIGTLELGAAESEDVVLLAKQ